MGSENLFLNCYWMHQNEAGVKTCNFNALQNTVMGGNFAGCLKRGIQVLSGAVDIFSTGFQDGGDDQTGYDVEFDNSADDHSTLLGCRTESKDFVLALQGHHVQVVNCNQVARDAGIFARGSNLALDGCTSVAGHVELTGSREYPNSVRGCLFGRTDWLQIVPPGEANSFITLENNVVRPGGGANDGQMPSPTRPYGKATSVLPHNVVLGTDLYAAGQAPTADAGVDGAILRDSPTVLPTQLPQHGGPDFGVLIDMVAPGSGMPCGVVQTGSGGPRYIFGQQRIYIPIRNADAAGRNGEFLNLVNVMIDRVGLVVRQPGSGTVSVGDNGQAVTPGGASRFFHDQRLNLAGYSESPERGVIYDARPTTGTGQAGDRSIQVANPFAFNAPTGERAAVADVLIAGGGPDGRSLRTRVVAKRGSRLDLADPLATSVKDAVVSFVDRPGDELGGDSQWALWIEWNHIRDVEGYLVLDVSPFLPH